LYENALSSQTIDEDMEGQERPSISNPGADHYSLESIRFTPLTPADVGPNAGEDINTAIANVFELNKALVYPTPTNDLLYLDHIDRKATKIEILNLEGKILLSQKIENRESPLAIDTSKFLNGIYFVRLSNNDHYSESTKIVIQH